MATQPAPRPVSGSRSWPGLPMRWLMLVIGVLVVALAVLALASIVRDSDDAPYSVTLSGADSGRHVTVAQDGTLVVRLESNPTTGYTWAVNTLDESVMVLGQELYEAPVNGAVGQGGIQEFRFETLGTGDTGIELKYWRAWEGEASVIERFTVTVTVSER